MSAGEGGTARKAKGWGLVKQSLAAGSLRRDTLWTAKLHEGGTLTLGFGRRVASRCGFLFKRGEGLTGVRYKKRFFVLDGTSLVYYKEGELDPAQATEGSVHLSGEIRELGKIELTGASLVDRGGSFDITTAGKNGRKFHLQLATKAKREDEAQQKERIAWMDAILRAVSLRETHKTHDRATVLANTAANTEMAGRATSTESKGDDARKGSKVRRVHVSGAPWSTHTHTRTHIQRYVQTKSPSTNLILDLAPLAPPAPFARQFARQFATAVSVLPPTPAAACCCSPLPSDGTVDEKSVGQGGKNT
jgi:hypothetical protein